MDGVINIFKNTGMTSFDVVRIVKKVSGTKKVGHTGTLDPEASGVLPVCIGKGTKIIDYIMKSDKIYEVEFKLGITTTTYDLEGEIIEEKDPSNLNNEKILMAINSFIGEYNQIPPMYSALKQNGVRLYELARKGIEVEREGRLIKIINIENVKINTPYVSMKVTCSKGTYIRSLCYDIGNYLEVGAAMTNLKRSKTSKFTEEDSVNINDINLENIKDFVISIEDALDTYDKLVVLNKYSRLLINGVRVFDRRFTKEDVELEKLYRVYDEDGSFIGLGKSNHQGFKIEKLLIN